MTTYDASAPGAVVRPPATDLALLAVVVVAISTSGPLVAACAAPALAISFWRCLLSTGLTSPFAWRQRRSGVRVDRATLRLTAISGLLLGAHFATWVPSLRFTSVASSTALAATQPVWAALLAARRGARVAPRAWAGIAVALLGILVLTGVDLSLDPRSLVGDGLALVGAMFSAAYVTVGEQVRRTLPTSTYTTLAYGVAAGMLLVLCVVLRQPLSGYSPADWGRILALTFGAQLLGHTLVNKVLETTSATVVSMAILFEMPGATLVAAWWLGQTPPWGIVPAVVLLFVGLALVITSGDRRTPSESPPV